MHKMSESLIQSAKTLENTEPSSGTPKIINYISKLNKISQKPLLAMIYGSQNPKSDLDIFLIYDFPVKKSVYLNKYDLNQLEINDFFFRLLNKDVEYTEPLLTGKYIYGKKEILTKSIEFLESNDLREKNFEYLKKRSIETFVQAENFYSLGKEEIFKNFAQRENALLLKKRLFNKNNKFDSIIINKALSTLTYTLSYLASIKRYKKKEKTITIKEILENPKNKIEETFSNLRNYFKKCSKKEEKLSFKKINFFFNQTKKILTGEIKNE